MRESHSSLVDRDTVVSNFYLKVSKQPGWDGGLITPRAQALNNALNHTLKIARVSFLAKRNDTA
jgi:hypothetical protein